MALREGWNFHNDIAIPVEWKLRKFYGDTFYNYAGAIESGKFIETIEKILLYKADENAEKMAKIDLFISSYEQYRNVSGNTIPQEICHEIYVKFEELLKTL